MKFDRPTVLLAALAITAVWVASETRQQPMVSTGSDARFADHPGSDQVSSQQRTEERVVPPHDYFTSPPTKVALQPPQDTANHAGSHKLSGSHRQSHQNIPPPAIAGSARKVFIIQETAHGTDPSHLAQPAVWVDLGALVEANPGRDLAIQQEAERLVEQLANSNLPAESNEYRALWNLAVADSDEFFRKRYGDVDWMTHHVHAHHLAAARQETAP